MGAKDYPVGPVRDAVMVGAIQAMDEGEGLNAVAERLGLAPSLLRAWLLSEVPEQYRAAQARGLILRIVDCDDKLEAAGNAVGVNKAAHACRFARWDAERRLPRMFAAKTEVSGPDGGPIRLELPEVARRLAFILAQGRPVQDAEIVADAGDRMMETVSHGEGSSGTAAPDHAHGQGAEDGQGTGGR